MKFFKSIQRISCIFFLGAFLLLINGCGGDDNSNSGNQQTTDANTSSTGATNEERGTGNSHEQNSLEAFLDKYCTRKSIAYLKEHCHCEQKNLAYLKEHCAEIPEWLKEAQTSEEVVSFHPPAGSVVWHEGTWHEGSWGHGHWENGIWENGTWRFGRWENGTWEKWHMGKWHMERAN